MYGWDEDFREGCGNSASEPGGQLWKGGNPGFSRERWRIWRRQFGAWATEERIGEDLRAEARRAEARMVEIEAEGT